jgi:hypothetical protein
VHMLRLEMGAGRQGLPAHIWAECSGVGRRHTYKKRYSRCRFRCPALDLIEEPAVQPVETGPECAY